MDKLLGWAKRFWGWLVGALALIVTLTKVGTLIDWMRSTLATGVIPKTPQTPHEYLLSLGVGRLLTAGFILLVGSIIGIIELYHERRALRAEIRQSKEKVEKTLLGMMTAATRIAHQLYPLAQQPPFMFERVKHEYYVEKDGTAEVHSSYKIKAHGSPLHFWKMDIYASDAATPMDFLDDIGFKIRDVAGKERVAYLVTKNATHSKELSVFFLPLIAPGDAREIAYSFTWPGFLNQLLKTNGAEDFQFQMDAHGAIPELEIAIYFHRDLHKDRSLSCTLPGNLVPGARLDPAEKSPNWKGWCYKIANAPGEGFEYLIRVKANG